MPRYLISSRRCLPEELQRATALLTSRFPEISFDSHHIDDDGVSHLSCSAPSEEHARRWLQAADIGLESIVPRSGIDCA